jgi:aminopeptidase N
MIRTILGPDKFRKGLDLYFDRHDGDAATIEQFLKAFEDASGERSHARAVRTPLVRRHWRASRHALPMTRWFSTNGIRSRP